MITYKDIDLNTSENIYGSKTINASLFNILNTATCTMPGLSLIHI